MKKKSLISWITNMLLKIIPSLEKEVIFKMAAKSGCDWDGDILRIYVNESERSVEVLKP